MGNIWIESLKEYNKGHNKWCVVKKGTKEYDEVKKIMEKKKSNKEKDGVVIHDKRTFDERQSDMKKASESARKDSIARSREARQLINPSNKAVREANKILDKLPKKEINKDYIPVNYDLSQTKRKKRKSPIVD